jgi:O-antigen ligase/polysaccharide polymerase Wzy-like membrane protein
MRRRRADLDLPELARLVPAAGVLIVWTVLMFRSGGYHPGTWLPAGLVLVALLVLAVVGGGRLLPAGRPERTALLVLLGFTAWCFVSIAWSDGRGASWEAANLLLVGVLGAWTLTLASWRTRTAQAFMLGLSIAAAAACLVALLSSINAGDLTADFEDYRFSPPLDYPNSTAAFAFMAAIPALLFSARPHVSVPAKAFAQGLATFLCAFALLPQSRGSILGGVATIAIVFWVVPFRWRLFAHVVLLAAAVLAVAATIGGVYTAAAGSGSASGALRDAFTAMLLASGAAVIVGAGLAVAEERVAAVADQWEGVARRGAIIAGALAVLAIAGAGIAKSATISDTLSDQWQALKHPGGDFQGKQANASAGRLSSTDPLERYDYWRVALDGFRANPIGGMGAGGFEHRYALERRYPKPSRYPHNVVMKVLGDTGLVGIALMIAFLVLVTRGLVSGARRRPSRERAVAATALATLVYFLAHGLFDWLEAYPVLVGPALAFPLIALVVRGRAERLRGRQAAAEKEDREESPRPRPLQVWPPTAAVALLACATLLAPWLALRYRERASDTWRSDAAAAYRDLDRAAALDPLSAQPLVLRGVIGLSRGDAEIARDGFERALEREEAWLPHFGLAVLAADDGDRATAERELEIAQREHPEDPVLPAVAERVLSKDDVDPAAALRDVLAAPQADQERIS